jgi:hypothetical protein
MRIFLTFLAAAALGACSSSSSAPPTSTNPGPAALDCAWISAADNCYRKLVDAVDACIGPKPVAGGVMGLGDRSCGRGGADGKVDFNALITSEAEHFTVTVADKKCLEQFSGKTPEAAEWRMVGADGQTIKITSGATLTVTCPDGKVYAGPSSALSADKCSGGVLPGFKLDTASGISFQINGTAHPQFSCGFVNGGGDAGADSK